MYAALLRRDAAYEGVFYAAVRTTGVFCRPTCPARKPREHNVEFYPSASDALGAGYRPCLRCHPMHAAGVPPAWIARLLEEVERAPSRRWRDADLRAMAIDPVRVRRWFRSQHGMTFHAYSRARRLGLALGRIREGADLTQAAYAHGFDSNSGFRDAFVQMFRQTPARSRARTRVVMTRVLTPLGPMMVGATDEGVCLLEFADRRMLETQIVRLGRWLECSVVPGGNEHTVQLAQELQLYFDGSLRSFTVPLVMPGTSFQVAVWEALLDIPYGQTRSYQQQAALMGRPGARRAVGRANGDNRLAILVPCHRVVRSDGSLSGYGGGLWRKRFLLDHEQRAVPSTNAARVAT